MPILITTIGGSSSNSYVTQAEANTYFGERVPLVPPWVASGQETALIMATRVLEALTQPRKTLFPGPPAYYRVHPQWTGARATRAQRLSWPRINMYDRNGNALDTGIVSSDLTAPQAVITTSAEHGLLVAQKVIIFDHTGSTPSLNGEQVVSAVSSTTTFSVTAGALSVGGTGGRVTILPQELKDATAELAGQLLIEDRTLDNEVVVQGLNSIRAGSVSLGFNKDIIERVLPQAVLNLLPYGWLTDELWERVVKALFDIVSD